MHMVAALAAKAFVAVKGAAAAVAGAGGGAGAAGASGGGSGFLAMVGKAGNTVSALSQFGIAAQKSNEARMAAWDEQMAARGEYISAQETANALNEKYAQVAGDQLAIASASGIDLSSGSVTQARMTARRNADTTITAVRNNAYMNATLRGARARALKASGSTGGIAGGASALANLASDISSWSSVGKKGG